jgi:hypothetical protein
MLPGAPAALSALALPDGPSGRCGCAPPACVLGLRTWPSARRVGCTATAREGPARMADSASGL